jgi:FHA domain
MLRAGERRRRMARTLNAAYGDGLLSETTFAHRLDVLLRSDLIEPARLIGDLTVRSRRPVWTDAAHRFAHAVRELTFPAADGPAPAPALLALDWTGGHEELLVGRHPSCDVVLEHASVSRRHARLAFRDGNWVLRDLESTNGTVVNGQPVIRCRLLPGDLVTFGDEGLLVD